MRLNDLIIPALAGIALLFLTKKDEVRTGLIPAPSKEDKYPLEIGAGVQESLTTVSQLRGQSAKYRIPQRSLSVQEVESLYAGYAGYDTVYDARTDPRCQNVNYMCLYVEGGGHKKLRRFPVGSYDPTSKELREAEAIARYNIVASEL